MLQRCSEGFRLHSVLFHGLKEDGLPPLTVRQDAPKVFFPSAPSGNISSRQPPDQNMTLDVQQQLSGAKLCAKQHHRWALPPFSMWYVSRWEWDKLYHTTETLSGFAHTRALACYTFTDEKVTRSRASGTEACRENRSLVMIKKTSLCMRSTDVIFKYIYKYLNFYLLPVTADCPKSCLRKQRLHTVTLEVKIYFEIFPLFRHFSSQQSRNSRWIESTSSRKGKVDTNNPADSIHSCARHKKNLSLLKA